MKDINFIGFIDNKPSGMTFYDQGPNGTRLNIAAHGDLNKQGVGLMALEKKLHSAAEFNTNYLSKIATENHNSIRLITCHSADGMENSFAAKLSKLTNKRIEGYHGTVEANDSIERLYSDVMKSANGVIDPS